MIECELYRTCRGPRNVAFSLRCLEKERKHNVGLAQTSGARHARGENARRQRSAGESRLAVEPRLGSRLFSRAGPVAPLSRDVLSVLDSGRGRGTPSTPNNWMDVHVNTGQNYFNFIVDYRMD